MRKEIKIFLLIFIFNFGGCSVNCDDVPNFLNIEGFEIAIKRINNVYNDGSFSTSLFDTNNSIDFDKLLIEFTATGNYFGQIKSFDIGDLFVNTAYVSKCPRPTKKP